MRINVNSVVKNVMDVCKIQINVQNVEMFREIQRKTVNVTKGIIVYFPMVHVIKDAILNVENVRN